jgi:hypothetical protein
MGLAGIISLRLCSFSFATNFNVLLLGCDLASEGFSGEAAVDYVSDFLILFPLAFFSYLEGSYNQYV